MNMTPRLIVGCCLALTVGASEYPPSLSIKSQSTILLSGDEGREYALQRRASLDSESEWITWTNFILVASPTRVEVAGGPEDRQFHRAVSGDGGLPHLDNPAPDRLVWIPPGTFLQGSPENELGRYPEESPQHRVILTRGFFLDKHEVSEADYLAVIGENPSILTDDLDQPVEWVSWIEATNYCAKLTASEQLAGRLPEGYAYRLPTEAEWEYACRAGNSTRFSYGDDPDYTRLRDYAWYYDNGGKSPHKVGTRRPNGRGLYDMHGNVFEWCQDWSAPYTRGTQIDPQGPPAGTSHVVRGGGWAAAPNLCRSAFRYAHEPDYRCISIGFRVVLAPR